VAITLAVPEGHADEFVHKPGQSITLRRAVDGVEHRRTYSICSPVGAPLRIGVREVPGGVISGWLVRDLAVGDEVEIQSPSGSFAADPATPARHVLVAAGSGITPLLSIASSVLACPESHVTLVYGNRRADTVMFTEDLADLKDECGSRLQLVHVLSREPRPAEMLSGRLDTERITAILRAFVPFAEVDHFWLCGPFEMVNDARQAIDSLGIEMSRVHQELFFVEDTAPKVTRATEDSPDSAAQVTIVLDGATSTLSLPRDTAILDAAQKSRDDLPFACKGGVCGTCRAKVTSGDVEMRRNYALEPAEVADGFVLTCQSYPTTDEVTVDFDA
jgi:ring-1,2-phenylacetyl-CoA epoxidase subunit PaaE